jgi:OsmC-like protein
MTALASCFTTTFHAIAGYSKFEYTDLAVETEGTVSKTDTGYGFSEIVIRPSLIISSEEQRERAISLLHKAKALCLVSRALSTAQKFEARVEIRVVIGQLLPPVTQRNDVGATILQVLGVLESEGQPPALDEHGTKQRTRMSQIRI